MSCPEAPPPPATAASRQQPPPAGSSSRQPPAAAATILLSHFFLRLTCENDSRTTEQQKMAEARILKRQSLLKVTLKGTSSVAKEKE